MHHLTRARLLRALVVAFATTAMLLPATASAASAATVRNRSFSCAGNAGDRFTAFTVTGRLTRSGVPYHITTTAVATATSVVRAGRGSNLGSSALQTGYRAWDITGPNANGDRYVMHVSPVLPGRGGFFDAQLEVQYAGGASGGNQIPMFDCSVAGGPSALAHPAGTRSFTCAGSLGLARTARTITGSLDSANRPFAVVVSASATATVESSRARAASLGASPLHQGFTTWNVTGGPAIVSGDVFQLHVPPVLPAKGGYFDADMEIVFAGGANGSWQIPMFDCTVR